MTVYIKLNLGQKLVTLLFKQIKVDFANKHEFKSSVLAIHDYLVHARNNKLNNGWSKLLIDVMNNNFQSDLASELKPSMF